MIWREIMDTIGFWYNEFIEWYFVQPIYGQILALVGIIAIIAISITLIYYLIKGIAYLVYYIIKGIYYLLKGIGLGIFKLCKGFYNLVSGEYKSVEKSQKNTLHSAISNSEFINTALYCTECGRGFSDKMLSHLNKSGTAFCVNCGKEFKLEEFRSSPVLTY